MVYLLVLSGSVILGNYRLSGWDFLTPVTYLINAQCAPAIDGIDEMIYPIYANYIHGIYLGKMTERG